MGRKNTFTDAQIVGAIREVEAGAKPGEVSRKMGVTVQTLARWSWLAKRVREPRSALVRTT